MTVATMVTKAPGSFGTKLSWESAKELSINHWYLNKDENMPKVRIRLLYTNTRIHVKFDVQEEHILAKHLRMQDSVCRDSCVEFFLSINGSAYINFEINCIGTYLCYKCSPGRKFKVNPLGLTETDFMITTSLPGGQAIPEPVKCPSGGYTVEFSIPFAFINGVLGGDAPQAGTVWKCNFYKCGDELPNPHWGSWSQMLCPELDFHKPEFFGDLVFG